MHTLIAAYTAWWRNWNIRYGNAASDAERADLEAEAREMNAKHFRDITSWPEEDTDAAD